MSIFFCDKPTLTKKKCPWKPGLITALTTQRNFCGTRHISHTMIGLGADANQSFRFHILHIKMSLHGSHLLLVYEIIYNRIRRIYPYILQENFALLISTKLDSISC